MLYYVYVYNGCILLQHCDKVIPLEYPDKAKGKKKTIFNRVIINDDEVELVMKEETKTWTLSKDRSGVSVCCGHLCAITM